MNSNSETERWIDALVREYERPLRRYAFTLLRSLAAGHTATAFYELVPVGRPVPGAGDIDPLKYQTEPAPTAGGDDLLTAKLRCKQPDGDTSTKLEFPLTADAVRPLDTARDFRFASAVAACGMLLRDSPHLGTFSYADVLALAESDLGADPGGYRREFLNLVRNAAALPTP